nr:VENN motif pre-toxin domain-containing protein [Pantoea ananatis]
MGTTLRPSTQPHRARVIVCNHPQLDGAVIASTADKDRNVLDTGTLGWRDIQNQADYKSEHQSAGFNTGGPVGSNLLSNVGALPISAAEGSGHAEGSTKAAVSDGNIIIRNRDAQQQDLSGLSRDTEHANDGSISPIFDKEKEQRRLQQAQLAYDQAIVRQGADMGGSVRTGVSAVVNALQALAGGDIRAALAQGAAPYLAAKVKELTTGNAPYGELTDTQKLNNLMAHALLGGVVAELSGGSAAAGATGAVTGELATPAIALALYGTADSDKLSPEQKANLSALATLASGIAAGVSSGSTAGAATGALAGKNAVENNLLSATQSLAFDKELSECRKSGGDCQAVIDKWKQVSDKQSAETDQKLKNDPVGVQVWDKDVAQGGSDMANRPGWLGNLPGVDVMTSDEAKAYVQQWNGQDLAKIDQNSPGWTKFAVFASDPENQAAVASIGMLGKDLFLIAKNSFTTKSLLKEMTAQGIKFTPENIVSAAKNNNGKIVFLEKGNSKAGLQHIIGEHKKDFANIGVSEAKIPSVVMKAISEGKVVGYQGKGTGRPIYETVINGEMHRLAITVSSNGFVVGANPAGRLK